jgi:hypothetical protein
VSLVTLAEIAIWGIAIAPAVLLFYMIEVLSQD